MMSYEFRPTVGAPAPVASDSYQRAVFKAAPKRFTIEFLPPTKLGSAYHHGLRICPITKGDRSSVGSSSSTESITQYDVWRSWDDCLWLQDTLELEYKRSARERRVRLAQGKGVKTFNGMYKQDMASSWESLPPGPEPTSVATDVHSYIPYLTKKGTFFRPKPGTIERRQQEFQTLVEALMSDEMPTLIKEIRATRVITDFFGFWRRDLEFDKKLRKQNPAFANAPRNSITSAVWSAYFPSSSSIQNLSSRSSKRSLSSSITRRPDSVAETVKTEISTTSTLTIPTKPRACLETPKIPTEREARRHSSSSESSAQSEEAVSDSSYTANASAPKIAEDSPVKFNYNPARGTEPPSPGFESKHDDDFVKSPLELGQSIHIHRRGESKAADRRSNRSCQVFSSSPVKAMEEVVETEELSSLRESWQTSQSADTYLEDLGFEFPGTPKDERVSMQSFSTLRTVDSAEGVIPYSPRNSGDSGHELHMPRASVPVSLSDFDIFSESEGKVSHLNSFSRPLSYLPEESDSRPETPVADIRTPPPRVLPTLLIPPPAARTSYFLTPSPVPPASPSPPISPVTEEYAFPTSPTTSRYSDSFSISTHDSEATTINATNAWSQSPTSTLSSPKAAGSITLKISLNNSIIMLKVSRDISYADLRQRIYNKFVGQEGVPLSDTFEVLQRSNADGGSYKTVDSDLLWRELSDSFEGSKLLLYVLDLA